eukprot:COSAG02_NODE_1714_length_11220_cov_3.198543_7_plen_76_part_00
MLGMLTVLHCTICNSKSRKNSHSVRWSKIYSLMYTLQSNIVQHCSYGNCCQFRICRRSILQPRSLCVVVVYHCRC